jgi:hypothetical protein
MQCWRTQIALIHPRTCTYQLAQLRITEKPVEFDVVLLQHNRTFRANNKQAESNGSKDGSKHPNARTKWLVEHEPSYNVEPSTQNNLDQLEFELKEYPDKFFVNYLLNSLRFGFDMLVSITDIPTYEC